MTSDSNQRTAPPRRSLNGVVLLDKASGFSSNSSLQKLKRLFRARKAGHTGSLDPLASGLLPICLGEATKMSAFLLDSDKRYRVRVRLGAETDTADVEGEVTARFPVPELGEGLVETALERFRGDILQVPPMYSALKHQGRRLYDLARQGVEVERPPRPVTLYQLTLEGFGPDYLDLAVHCSKGTYIRTLAEEIGRELGSGGHVEILRRTAAGRFDLSGAVTMDQLEALSDEARLARILPFDCLVEHLPRVELNDEMSRYVRRGEALFVPASPVSGMVRLYGRSLGFLGIGEVLDDGRIGPRRMINLSPADATPAPQPPV